MVVAKEVKVIVSRFCHYNTISIQTLLVHCYALMPADRPDFVDIQRQLEALPRKHGGLRSLQRSPSHPVGQAAALSRSAESVF